MTLLRAGVTLLRAERDESMGAGRGIEKVEAVELTSLQRPHILPIHSPNDPLVIPVDRVLVEGRDALGTRYVFDRREGPEERARVLGRGREDVGLPVRGVTAEELDVDFAGGFDTCWRGKWLST